MKPSSVPSSLWRSLIVFIMILIMVQPSAEISAQPLLQRSGNISQVMASGPLKLAASASGCQWTYYPISGGKLQHEQLLFNDPDNTPLTDLSLGNLFKGKSTQLANTGSTDFDGDNKTDVFRTLLRSDGFLQWQYSSGGTGPWQNLAYTSSLQLQFGNFNNDAQTDVFASQYNNGLSAYQWLYSPSGLGNFAQLNTDSLYRDRMALGDFNGDGVTDVFTATQGSGTYQWAYSSGGTGSLTNLAFSNIEPSLLRFGDFNGDGTTDVFAGVPQPDGSTLWEYSNGGVDSFTTLDLATVPYSDLLFGDFNGDGKTDVIAPVHQSNGSLDIQFWSGGTGVPVSLGNMPAPAPALRVGDFNGDGISDLLAYRCGMKTPLSFTARQTLADTGFNPFNRMIYGDVNGDGQNDVILVSTCQGTTSSICVTHHLQVGVALGTHNHTYILVAPKQLGANSLDFEFYRAMAGDFDGDGKIDLALIDPYANSDTDLILYVARSNGDGTFTLGSPQTFAGNWSQYNPMVGDFNGDGKADLLFTTVCTEQALNAASCSNGYNNSLYVATSTGAGVFSLGAGQNLGPATGWSNYVAYPGDFNGDGKTDVVFNSTCQNNPGETTCKLGDANLVYTALSNGTGGFTLSALQNYGASGWSDFSSYADLTGDLNGDGRTDLVWSSPYQSSAKTNNNLIVVGMANPDGTFQVGSVQNFASAWSGSPSLTNLNQDGKADLLWNHPPYDGETDVDTYAAAISNGNGTFENLGPGSVDTGPGYFSVPDNDSYSKLPAGLTVLSNWQDSISSALFIINGFFLGNKVYLPLVRK